jgi:hypothetical protein
MTNVAVRLRNGIVACVREAVDRVERKANSVKSTGYRHMDAAVSFIKAVIRSGTTTWSLLKPGIAKRVSVASAYVHRYYYLMFYFAAIASVLVPCRIFWGAPAITDLFATQKGDTSHATLYYAVTVIFLPLQTLLVLVGGAYGWQALRQNLRFKQHEVEASCVRDYVAIDQRFELAASDGEKIKEAVRAYWALIVYEYYWWRRGLVSRTLFTIWCEFHVQKFRKNAPYKFPSDGTPPFGSFREGFEFCRSNSVFSHPSVFDDLMQYLIKRADNSLENLQWYDIEHYRRGWRRHF